MTAGGTDPDAMARAGSKVVRGAPAVAKQALVFSRAAAQFARPALVNGAVGLVVVAPQGRPMTVLAFELRRGKILELEVIADPARFPTLDLAVLPE
jgi:hypothetical protein